MLDFWCNNAGLKNFNEKFYVDDAGQGLKRKRSKSLRPPLSPRGSKQNMLSPPAMFSPPMAGKN